MPVAVTWAEIAIRLFCAAAASALIGINRSERGRPAGLRTSMLVCLAACLAMIQVNLLLPLAGRSPDSFVMNDLMRLPLGILSGIGFIGAGAIVRRDNFVGGVTTAATIWFLTVIGLCFGGGQIALGLVGAALGMLVLMGLKLIEDRMQQDHQAQLVIVTGPSGPDEAEIRAVLENSGFRISSCGFGATQSSDSRKLNWDLNWRARPYVTTIPEAVHLLLARPGVVSVAWTPNGTEPRP
jgi:putative Mg2+ transporter-C (MgtC) family protein